MTTWYMRILNNLFHCIKTLQTVRVCHQINWLFSQLISGSLS